jgi:hypothetical protein
MLTTVHCTHLLARREAIVVVVVDEAKVVGVDVDDRRER